jgi:hypothetical protein
MGITAAQAERFALRTDVDSAASDRRTLPALSRLLVLCLLKSRGELNVRGFRIDATRTALPATGALLERLVVHGVVGFCWDVGDCWPMSRLWLSGFIAVGNLALIVRVARWAVATSAVTLRCH